MYHRIAAPPSDLWRLAVSPSHFVEHLDVIRADFHPISLYDLVKAIGAGSMPRRAVAFTFDDGYRDNLYTAKPLLERYDVPATVFVTTEYIDAKTDFWWDEIEQLLVQENRVVPIDHRALRTTLQRLGPTARRESLDAMWRNAGVDRPEADGGPTAAEIIALDTGSLIEIGAHTSTHPSLTTQSRAVQEREIRSSKDLLEDVLGHPIDGFSYPHGHFDRSTVRLVQEAGFSRACTTESAPTTARTDPFKIPRISVDDSSGEELARRLDSLFA